MTADERIKTALDKLRQGRPELSDGHLTVANVCLEAGVSRASFYRSAHAGDIRQALTDPGGAPRPETEELRDQARALRKTEKTLRSQHAAEVRELRSTVQTYANQIQFLALRVGHLEDDNRRLLHRLDHAGDNITPLPARP